MQNDFRYPKLKATLCRGLFAVSVLSLSSTVLAASDAAVPDLTDVLTASGITVSGHTTASYTGGFNHGQQLAYRAFDTNSNTFTLNQAMLNISKLPTEGFGAYMTLTGGSDAQAMNAAYGTGASDFNLSQAYVQYATGPLTVMVGTYWTMAGLEIADGTLDANISRSLLFQNAQPVAHTGVRAMYKVSDAFTAYLGLNNSATGLVSDNNKQKTLEAGATYVPSTSVTLSLFDYFGYEGTAPVARTNYLDGVAVFQLSEPMSLSFNADYFRQQASGVDVYAAGVGMWLGYQFNPKWKGTFRGEYLTTKNVVKCTSADGACALGEVTYTVDYQPYKSATGTSAFDVMAEVRYDLAGENIFPNANLPATDTASKQGNVALSVVYKF